VALTPVGLIASVVVAYAVAAILGVTLDPSEGPALTAGQNAIVYSIAGIVWLAAPAAAVALASRPARAGSRSGRAAFVVGGLLLVAGLVLLVSTLVNP
jgi:hypothetical protein